MLYWLYLRSVEQFDSVMWICFSVCLFFPFAHIFQVVFLFFPLICVLFYFPLKKGLTGLSGRQIRPGKQDMLLLSVIICLSPMLVMGYDLCFQLLLGNYPCRSHEQLCLATFPHVSQGQHFGRKFLCSSFGNHVVLVTYLFPLSCKLHCLIGHICRVIIKYIESPRKDISETQTSGIILWIND